MKPKNPKEEIWAVLEEIPQNTLFMMSIPCRFFMQEWPKLGLGNKVSKYFTCFDGDYSKMCYVRSEFEAEAEFLAKKMLSRLDWALSLLEIVRTESTKFFILAKRFRVLNLKRMSNRQLLKEWKMPLRAHRLSHGIGGAVSWHADAEKELITRALSAMIEKQITKYKVKVTVAEAFRILSSPLDESFIKKEEVDLLELAVKIKHAKNLKKFERLLENHAEKYNWLNYQYKGPVYQIDYFRDRLEALLHSRKGGPEKLLHEIVGDRRDLFTLQQKLKRDLYLDLYQQKLLKMAQAMVFIKGYRKDALYHGIYCYEPFFREVGQRFGLSLDQVRAMNYWEIEDVLRGKKVDADELNERLKFCVAWCDPKNYIVYVRKKARELLERTRFEKADVEELTQFTGTCACPGKARGVVKIINTPEDIAKMKKGDILLSFNTNPNLMPAIRLASAIVTQSGGLTCHAAIVSREFDIPCVVGIPNLIRAFRDGDKVEVDAGRGIILRSVN